MSALVLGGLVGAAVTLLALWILAPLLLDAATISPRTARVEELAAEVRDSLAEPDG